MNSIFTYKRMQIKKEEMRVKICEAALKQFAETGFLGATMADIACEAEISVGNIYRYYTNKKDLFYSLITPAFVENCKEFIVRKIRLAHGRSVEENQKNQEIAAFHEAYLDFLIKHRRQIVIVMEHSQGTQYEHERDEVIQLMTQLVAEYVESRGIDLSEDQRVILTILYRNLLQGTVEILKMAAHEERIGSMLQELLTYHFAGLSVFSADRDGSPTRLYKGRRELNENHDI